MAEYRLHYKKGKVGYAGNHAAYILREKNYKTKEDLLYKESGNLGTISANLEGNLAVKFWETADYCERVNSVAYRELEIMIPNELNRSQAIEVIQNFVKKEIGTDYPYSFAIHESYNKQTNVKNLHCHLMFSERKIDGIQRDLELFFKRANSKKIELGGAKKDRIWQKKDRLLELRKSWEVEANLVLEKYGFEERIDCRSLKDRRKEAIANEEFEKAELYNREAINLSKKVARKLNRNGYKSLSPEEKKEVEIFNNAKEIKAQKIREYKIQKSEDKSNILTQEEIVKRIEILEKKDEGALKRQTLNIISRGKLNKELYSLRLVERSLIAYPNNEVLLNKQKELQTSILEVAHEHTLTPKYNRILTQLHRDKETKISYYKEYLKEYYNTEYEVKSREIKEEIKQENQESIKNKYANKSIYELKYRLSELEMQDNKHHAIQILSKYRVEGIGQNIILLDEKIKNLKEKEKELAIYNLDDEIKANKKVLDEYQLQKSKCEKEADSINKELEKNKDKHSALWKKINNNSELEKTVLKSLIDTKEDKNMSIENKIKYHIQVISDYENIKRLHNYYSNNNLNEKHNKNLYFLHNRLNGMEKMYQESFNELKNFKNREIQKVIVPMKEKITTDNLALEKRIEVLTKANLNLKKFLDNKKIKGNYTALQLIALNKASKGEYSKNYLEKERIRKEKNEVEFRMNKTSFLRKYNMNKTLKELNSKLDECVIKEEKLMKEFENTDILKGHEAFIGKNIEKSIKIISKEIRTLSTKVNKNKTLLYKVNELEDKKSNKNRSLERSNAIQDMKELTDNLRLILRKGEEKSYINNNLDLKLERQKEEQWER